MRPENVKDGEKLHNKLVIKDLTFSYTWLIINECFEVPLILIYSKQRTLK